MPRFSGFQVGASYTPAIAGGGDRRNTGDADGVVGVLGLKYNF